MTLCRVAILLALLPSAFFSQAVPVSERSKKAITSVEGILKQEFTAKKLCWGSPLFIRIFKEEKFLEVWVKRKRTFELFTAYPICYFSGNPGPKLKEGDKQAPEGFYYTRPEMFNPNSDYHLSIDIGYPNDFDRSLGRTGSDIKIHGDCVSIGCYAMTDSVINRIWTLACAAFLNGQAEIPIHCFPFRMTGINMEKNKNSPWQEFWANLKEGYDCFESSAKVPKVGFEQGKYVITRKK